ncbi:M23 family metallopeptidase [Stigmatella sp. ncwal1]|uniref:M23 family metallopeptidase n=1 Tax=Stigmatella ashevillensis TaxID=2995309 RepID=A0ABT5DA49_9BACT|nr:M23 family metallopeptidase [Stigmatella ashevillena]MDC0710545.1 M23 family metallopeptidase [Stigmatella ashevillena]
MSPWKYATLIVLLCCSAVPLDAGAQPFMDWPLGQSVNSVPVMGYNVHIRRRFAAAEPGWKDGRQHTGIDMYWDDNDTVGTAGAPVYAALSGVVVCLPSTSFTPGKVVVLMHKDLAGAEFYSMYGHVEPASWLRLNQVVNRGEPIAVVAENPDAPKQAHLHFEIRKWFESPVTNDCLGPGYAPLGQTAGILNWWDPVYFYYNQRPLLSNTVALVDTEFNLRAGPSTNASILSSHNPAGPVNVAGVHQNTADNANGTEWWYETRFEDEQAGPVTAYVAGARPEPQEGFYGTYLHVGEVRHLDTACQCAFGQDQNRRPIHSSVTYCGYHVCGADNFAYECRANGWVYKDIPCNAPPTCPCGNFDDMYGTIEANKTYCGMRVCGGDTNDRMYECTNSGWVEQATRCN